MHVPSTFISLTTLQMRETQPVILFIIINETIHPFYEIFTFSHTTFDMLSNKMRPVTQHRHIITHMSFNIFHS